MAVTVKLEGFAELEKELEKLGKTVTQKASMRRALRKAAEPMVEAAKQKVPVDDGDLRDSITISTRLNKRQGRMHRRMFRDDRASVELFLGPSYELGGGGRHAHLVEFGTRPHINKGKFAGSQHPGTRPQPFMRPAWDEGARAILDRLKVELADDIKRALLRAERKAARMRAKQNG